MTTRQLREFTGVIVAATLLWAGMALAITPTPQQSCDYARITAWKVYLSCVNSAVAKDAKGVSFDASAAFAKCRHTYFEKWTAFQTKASLAGSTCIGSRFTDNGDQTVTDNLSGLVWEKKDSLDGADNPGDPHDADNIHTWSAGAPWAENGTAAAPERCVAACDWSFESLSIWSFDSFSWGGREPSLGTLLRAG